MTLPIINYTKVYKALVFIVNDTEITVNIGHLGISDPMQLPDVSFRALRESHEEQIHEPVPLEVVEAVEQEVEPVFNSSLVQIGQQWKTNRGVPILIHTVAADHSFTAIREDMQGTYEYNFNARGECVGTNDIGAIISRRRGDEAW